MYNKTEQEREVRLLKRALRILAGRMQRCPDDWARENCKFPTCEKCWAEWSMKEAEK
jgi:hypothetical protein